MNQSDFAKLHNVSRKTVTAWKARGWLVLAGDDIDVEASNANIERFRKTVTRPEKKAAGNTQGNKQGNSRKGNSSGNKSSGDPAESPAKIVEKMIAEKGVEMTIDEARAMKLYYADHFVLPLPDGHRFPMEKYALLRSRLQACGAFSAADFCVPAAASTGEILRAHDADYLHRVTTGTLDAAEIRRIGFPWSAAMVERSRRSAGATSQKLRVMSTWSTTKGSKSFSALAKKHGSMAIPNPERTACSCATTLVLRKNGRAPGNQVRKLTCWSVNSKSST